MSRKRHGRLHGIRRTCRLLIQSSHSCQVYGFEQCFPTRHFPHVLGSSTQQLARPMAVLAEGDGFFLFSPFLQYIFVDAYSQYLWLTTDFCRTIQGFSIPFKAADLLLHSRLPNLVLGFDKSHPNKQVSRGCNEQLPLVRLQFPFHSCPPYLLHTPLPPHEIRNY